MAFLRQYEEEMRKRFNYLQNIDFDHGFSSFHAKWRPRQSEAKPIWSPTFNTPVEGIPTVPKWVLRKCFRRNEEDRTITMSFHLEQKARVMVPIIYRMSVFDIDGTKILTDAGVRVCAEGDAVTLCTSCDLGILQRKLVLQLWLFVPNGFQNPNDQDQGSRETTRPQIARRASLRRRGSMRGADDRSGRVRGPADDQSGTSSGSETNNGARHRNADLFELVKRDPQNDEDESFSDVLLQMVNESREPIHAFRCHRHILAEKSDVFKCMFLKRTWFETSNADERVVEIPDVERETMEKVLAYMYLDELPKFSDSFENDLLVKLIYAADKYNLTELKYTCEFISIWRSNDQATSDLIDLLIAADMYRLNRWKLVCILQLCTDLSYIDAQRVGGRISNQLYTEMISVYEKYGCTTKEIELA